MKRLFRFLSTVFTIFAIWQVALRLLRKKAPFPAPAFIGRFLDSDLRRRMQPPGELIERSGFRPGMRVLELGCGSGGYTTFVARAVGPQGEVCALDIQPRMLAQLEAKLRRPEHHDLTNIRPYLGSAYELPFEDGSFDLVYTITVLQEIPDQDRALAEVRRVLKPGGILAVTEYLPDPDYPFVGTVVQAGKRAGLALDDVLGTLWTFTVRFRKPADKSIY